jgi:hypothetical protein
MDEARRFLRYVIPGALFATETLLLLLILIPDWTTQQLKENFRNESGIGLAITVLLGSGGLGFMFSTIHHYLYWHFPGIHPGPDYVGWVQVLRSRNLIQLRESRTFIEAEYGWPKEQIEAWSLITGLWHERIGTNKTILAANPRADTLANIVHSIGAATVAMFFALITSIYIATQVSTFSLDCGPVLRFISTLLIGGVLVMIHELSHRDVVGIANRFVEQVMTDAIVQEESTLNPAVTHVRVQLP